jgi:catalase
MSIHPETAPEFRRTHREIFDRILKANKPVFSLATIPFWSGHAYLMGPDAAMKFNFAPEAQNDPHPLGKAEHALAFAKKLPHPNYLRADLRDTLLQQSLKWAVNVQLENEKFPDKTPIEDASRLWSEKDSPSIRVGTLTIDKQDIDNNDSWCETVRFNPGHFHPLHRPLGNMGRGRIFVYRASQWLRFSRESTDSVRHPSDFIKK